MSNYSDFVARKRAQYGRQFDMSALAPQFILPFDEGYRVEVETRNGIKRGRIGVTTGWQPVFILMAKSNSSGSSVVLGPHDKIIRIVSK